VTKNRFFCFKANVYEILVILEQEFTLYPNKLLRIGKKTHSKQRHQVVAPKNISDKNFQRRKVP
jgi:hypothetical protein